ncbi:aldehyde dehydrogenase family protein [Novosphingobium sp. Gsoil 351]|uniref:aldehyde dehydrogenase family protein n=1 Tax=Novosphingobium sp. Gsoil 351 TaxID=2675225 RepID=UPI0012B4D6C6|nr:aldehyde dehydrogenase family protein [Novosphingobium sp. Gsoil 351]QGN53998.1 aldehyde dehydrogenase family protein [Novosphingobium sp. Gsoil 351]
MDAVREHKLFYGGGWHAPSSGDYRPSHSPANGDLLGQVADATGEDVDRAVTAALAGFAAWRDVLPLERARLLREIASVVRQNAAELVALDAEDCGNPVAELRGDAYVAAALMEYFAGLVTEMKGASIPVGPNAVNFSIRQPYGVVARILAFNHPFLFCVGKIAAPLAAGNAVIVKPSEQAPLSALRFAELVEGLLPAGTLSVLTGGIEAGAALAAHPKVAMVSLVGSVAAGRALMREASATLKPVLLELGGKNALIAYGDADPGEVASALAQGMNFAWCGQSCGSTSRAFVHAEIYDAVLTQIAERVGRFRPGDPRDDATSMGAIISERQHVRILGFIDDAKAEGARLVCGGGRPADPGLANGFFIEPTVFADVTPDMRLAREEVFGPILAIMKWSDEATMLGAVNELEFGLTCSIWTRDLERAHRAAMAVEVGYVWINETSRHILGAPFGGMKQSGIGREECLGELLAFTQEKNIYISLRTSDR